MFGEPRAHTAHCLYKDGLHGVSGPSLCQARLCVFADDAIPMQTSRKLRMGRSISATLDTLNLQVAYYSEHLHKYHAFLKTRIKGKGKYAGMSEIRRSCDVMLKTNAEYSHGLAPPAKIPVYLQALLLLLC